MLVFRPEILVTPTQDVGKILGALHGLKINGEADITTGLQIAQLALKHRQNKNQRQRVIVFVGSPLGADEKVLMKLGKKLKKNNVAVDIISFGEEENDARLRSFVETVSSGDNRYAHRTVQPTYNTESFPKSYGLRSPWSTPAIRQYYIIAYPC